ncbi:MAG: molybdate ABC transporter permease subunit [Bacteroidota bacterium]
MVIALPIAYWLAYTHSRIKPVVETLVAMPLVLPPTVLGFYFLIAFGPTNGLGQWLEEWFGLRLVFSFSGLVVASLVYSLPFMVHPLQSGLAKIPTTLKEAAYTLGKSRWQTFIHIILPNMKPTMLTGVVLAFAHTIGEFGVILMIGGSIPGKTKVASIAIYEEVEALQYAEANAYSLVLFAITFGILLLVFLSNGNYFKKIGG